MRTRLFASFVLIATMFTEVQAAPMLVDGDWLRQQLQNKQLVVVDMIDDDLQYTRFHLPGAVRLGIAP